MDIKLWKEILNEARVAVEREENIFGDGRINWNFVSADIWIDLDLGADFDGDIVEMALEVVAQEKGVA